MLKNILILVLLLGIGVLAYLYFSKVPGIIDRQIEKQAKELVDLEVKNVSNKIDKKGFEHAVIEDKQNLVKSLKELSDSSKRELDSVLMLLNIKEKQLIQYANYNTSLKAEILKASKSDSGFTYSDKYTKIEYIIPSDSNSSGHFNFNFNADISYTEYWKKSWILAPKKHYIDFWINDKRATINGVKRLKIEPKNASFRVDINAQSLYNGANRNLYFGSELEIDIGKLGLSGSYLYDPTSGRWFPFISGKYKIIGF